MEAKEKNMVSMTDEMDFFILIEKKLEEQGFEVLETLPPDGLSLGSPSSDTVKENRLKSFFTNRSSSRFAY